MWKLSFSFVFGILFLCASSLQSADEPKLLPRKITSKKPCKLDTPREGMSAEALMRLWFRIKYTRFASDYSGEGFVYYLSGGKVNRTRKWHRDRMVLEREKDDMDYKDLVVFTYPPEAKGLAVLTWAHLNRDRQHDIWIWLPSLKKVRRVPQSNADDSFMGTDLTVEDVTTRRLGDETYELLGEVVFPGYDSAYLKKKMLAGTPCFKIRAVPKRKDWYYAHRIVYIDKKTGAAVFDEYYDKRGRKTKTIFRIFEVPDCGCIAARMWECRDLRSDHSSVILMGDTFYNSGIKERTFTVKQLERNPW